MTFLNTITDIARGIGNILLPGQPFAKPQPISTVSSKPVEIGTTDTQTRTVYEPKSSLDVLYKPISLATAYMEKNPITVEGAKLAVAPLGTIKTIQTQEVSSGAQGNIWDILKKGAEQVIDTGVNALTQKLTDAKTNQKVETAYVPNVRTATTSFFTPSKLMEFLNPTVQPAVSEGVKQGIVSVVNKPPTWIWFVLAGLGVIILIPKLARR